MNKSSQHLGLFFGSGVIIAAAAVGSFVVGVEIFDLSQSLTLLLSLVVGVIVSLLFALINANAAREPIESIYATIRAIEERPETANDTLAHAKMDDRIKTYVEGLYVSQQNAVSQATTQTQVVVEERNKMRSVLNAIKEGVVALDIQSNIIFFNTAASDITGLNIEDAAGKPASDLLPIKRDGQPVLEQWLNQTVDKLRAEDKWDDAELQTISGETKPIDITAFYTRTDPTGVTAIITIYDKSAEAELENMKLDFVALAAHELRTPVTIIKGYTESLQTNLLEQGELTEDQKNYFKKLDYASNQLSGYINNILNVARIEKGQLSFKFEEADWREIVLESCKDLIERAQTMNRELKLALPSKLPSVSVDKASIVEVLNNLITNALKYSYEGTAVIVRVKIDENGQILTTVTDKGVGIPESLMGKLFKKFYRSHRTSTTHRGTGLGLYISKSIVDAHQGTIWVKSKEGEGSTFGFTLPPIDQFVNPDENDDNSKVIKGVHGWIKNHSLYRG